MGNAERVSARTEDTEETVCYTVPSVTSVTRKLSLH
jgi:hypothetical protein